MRSLKEPSAGMKLIRRELCESLSPFIRVRFLFVVRHEDADDLCRRWLEERGLCVPAEHDWEPDGDGGYVCARCGGRTGEEDEP